MTGWHCFIHSLTTTLKIWFWFNLGRARLEGTHCRVLESANPSFGAWIILGWCQFLDWPRGSIRNWDFLLFFPFVCQPLLESICIKINYSTFKINKANSIRSCDLPYPHMGCFQNCWGNLQNWQALCIHGMTLPKRICVLFPSAWQGGSVHKIWTGIEADEEVK